MALPTQAPIVYRDFHDVPRMFFVVIGTTTLLFDCRFDESIDDYASTYELYRMKPGFTPPEGDWCSLPQAAEAHLGSIPVTSVTFDPTGRRYIDASILQPFGL